MDRTRVLHSPLTDAYVERIADGREAYRRLLEENDRAESAAERQIAELRGEVVRVQEENAEREEEALKRRRQAREEVRLVEQENLRSLEEGRRQANEQLRAIDETRAEGNERVRESEEGLREAIQERRRTARDTDREIKDRLRDLDSAREDFRLAEVQRDRDIVEARKDVTDETKNLKRAQEEVAEAAEKTGAVLEKSEEALLASAQSFGAAFMATFRPARESMNYLLAEILEKAKQTLPYFGLLTERIVGGVRNAWQQFLAEAESPEQVGLFMQFFEKLPGVMENAVAGLSKLLLGLLNVFAEAPVEEMFEGFNNAMQRFLDWSQEGAPGLDSWLSTAVEWAGIFKDLAVAVARFLHRVSSNEGFQDMARNVAEFLTWLATDRGVQAGLSVLFWTLARLGDVILWFLKIPVLGDAVGFLGALGAGVALFGGLATIGAIGSLFTLYTVLRKLSEVKGFGWIGRALDALKRSVRAFGRGLTAPFRLLANGLRGIGGAARGALGPLRRFASLLRNGVRAGVRAARNALSRLPGIIRSGIRRGVNAARSAINRLRGVLRGGVSRAVNGVRSAINRLRAILRRGVLRAVNGARSAINRLRSILRRGVIRAVNAARSAINRLRGILRGGVARAVNAGRAAINRLRTALRRGVSRAVNAARSAIGRLRGILRGGVNRAVNVARSAINRLRTVLRQGVRRAVTAVRGALGRLGPVFSRIFGQGGVLRTTVREFITRFFGGTVGRLLARALFGPAGWIWTLWDLKPYIERWSDKLGNWINNAVEWAFGFRLDWFGPWLKERFRALLGDNIYDAVASVLGWEAEPFLRNAWEWLGETWVGGLAEGWSNKVGEFWERMKTWANDVYDWLKSFWESRSPSRKTMRLGASIMDGLILSAKAGGKTLLDVMARNARGAADALTGGLRGNLRSVEDAASRVSRAAMVDLPAMRQDYVLTTRPVTVGSSYDRSMMDPDVLTRAVERAVTVAMPARGQERQTIVIPIAVGGTKVDEYIVDVVDGAAREARRNGAAIAGRYR